MCVGLIKSIKGLNRKKLTYPEEEGILPANWFQNQTAVLPFSILLADHPDFGLVRLYN